MLAAAKDQFSVSSWLVPALLVLIMAVVSLIVTNARADRREWNKWRRDTLIKLCSDAMEAAKGVASTWEVASSRENYPAYKEDLAVATEAVGRIASIAEQLYLMNVEYLANICVEMKDAAEAMEQPTYKLHSARGSAKARLRSEQSEIEEEYAARGEDLDNPGFFQWIRNAEQDFHEEYVAKPEEAYNKARDELVRIRTNFLQRGQFELKRTV